MALFRTRSAAVFGIEAHLIDVEVDLYPGGNARDFVTVGMPDTAVRESRERIKSALLNSGFGYPNKSVTINLAPANVRKEGAGFDLPMALGILSAMGTVKATDHRPPNRRSARNVHDRIARGPSIWACTVPRKPALRRRGGSKRCDEPDPPDSRHQALEGRPSPRDATRSRDPLCRFP
jgi:hypothetical protein